MSDKDTTASPPSSPSDEAQVEATEEALESRGQLGRDYLWNTAASLMSSLAVVIMGVAIMRSGATDSFARAQYGLFTLALAIGQQYQTVGLYEVRTFHVTDVRRRFDFGTYLSTRLLTCLVMVGLIAYHSWNASTKDPYPAFTVIAAMALLRIFDAFEDVYYSEFQRAGRLDIAGKACFLRIFTTTFLWSGLYWFTQDLLTSTLITFAVTCVVLVVAYGLPARGVFPLLPSFNLRGIAGILWECLPLFLAAFLNQYLANAPRFAIHAALGDEELGVFAIIYMPAVAINMLSLFVFRPLLTRMALRWAEGKRGEFFAIVRKGLLTTAGAFVIVAAVTYAIGSPLLTLVFGTDVSGYVAELMVLVLAGALNAASVILYYALATMRRLHAVLAVFAVTGATAYLIAPALTRSYAMMGASLAYAATMGLLALLFTAVMLIPTRRAPIGAEPTTD
ncbi:lipopolysaccharide biosynthesis protein [Pauljensenia sp. UMB0018B]|uniref:Polysaccharide biosynthesis protein n=1 Tax=Schaalia odontolytica TaxID=1660 RepID=A0A2I1I110_9ACTO|nr:lipopolysaccharide biosynthesis protein [Schaalia odontolytica]MDK7339626.1 lipopolysaccharide biosynthesis protein [Pauljensenia sp. UMB0018B]PKY64824.1 polysaccharide biosynthesis protein [Schaalia odontolytica]